MGYFQAKKHLKFVQEYKTVVKRYYGLRERLDDSLAQSPIPEFMYPKVEEGIAKQIFEENEWNDYQALRAQVAKDTPRVHRIAHGYGMQMGITSYPAPAVGGPILRFNVFDAILHDPSHGSQVTEQKINDRLNELIELCEEAIDVYWSHLINPLYWIKAAFLFVLRLPTTLIRLAGFNVKEFEKHFWGKFIQLIWMIMVIGLLLILGLGRADVIDLIKKWLTPR